MELKEKTLGGMTLQELNKLHSRLRSEREVEDLIIGYICRSTGKNYNYEKQPKIDTKTPINQFYPNNEEYGTKSIGEMSSEELQKLIDRLRTEEDIAMVIYSLKRNSGENVDYYNPAKIDNSTPIKEMYHSGILGMKWGVHRYQNEDGTLTEAGKERYRSASTSAQIGSKILSSASKIGSNTSKSKTIKKSYSDLSDAELQKRVNRMRLEDSYGQLVGDTKYVRSGSEWTREILQSAGAVMGIAGGAVGIYLALKR